MSISDIHTHDASRAPHAIVNIYPGDEMTPGNVYSIGIHPWHTHEVTDEMLQMLEQQASNTDVVAIGEAGLDKLRGADIDTQERIFIRHIELSEALKKPLIIHAVKAYDRIIALHRRFKPTQRWIIHGFRGKPQQAMSLLNEGLDLSIGEKFNPEAAAIIPANRLFIESDESKLSIDEIRRQVAQYRADAVSESFDDVFLG